MTRRYALRDDQWERIKDLLPGRKQTVGVTAKDNRLFVEGVLYRYQAGFRDGTYRKDLGIFESFIPGSVGGQGVVCGKKYLRCSDPMLPMNMR
jgi:hypothetical protein